jgi:hypothetical protein
MIIPSTTHETIDEVIAQLDLVIERCRREHSKLGYFAVLYRDTTDQVRRAIAAGRFEDGPRMERFDVIFADRYLEAINRFWRGEKPTQSWSAAFQAARTHPPIILQHLLLGMSAHINLDLAIAAVHTAPGDTLPELKRDFYEITHLLAEMIDGVQERIEQVSPWFRFIDRMGGRTDERVCEFAIGAARDLAWRAAEKLAVMSPEEYNREVAQHDQVVAAIGHRISSPGGLLLGKGLRLIRLRERHPVHTVIEALKMV